ncbi:hypothetical protein AAMO2058_001670400 [Amorphochlora amoebiformis]
MEISRILSGDGFFDGGGEAKVLKTYTCSHLRQFWRGGGLRDILAADRYLSMARDPYSKVKSIGCSTCQTRLGQVRACLQCVFFGCVTGGHFAAHQKDSGHWLSMDCVRSGSYYCAQCNDYVYDWELDNALLEQQQTHGLRTRVAMRKGISWAASEDEKRLLRAYARPIRDMNDTLGLRGIQNLGSSCFMTVVLQCLCQNPFLRNFFLGDMHHPGACQGKNGKNGRSSLGCIACEMDTVFRQIFSGDTRPMNPHRFLYAVWTQVPNLSGYRQQDAHEFMCAVLEALHASFKSTTANNQGVASKNGRGECDCVIHRIFGGRIISDVRCLRCSGSSPTYQPMQYICLDIYYKIKNSPGSKLAAGGLPVSMPSSAAASPATIKSSPSVSPNYGNASSSSGRLSRQEDRKSPAPMPENRSKSKKRARSPNTNGGKSAEKRSKVQPVAYKYLRFLTLNECLEKYVLKENLAKADSVYCQRCKDYVMCSKQILIDKLAPTLVFQLKRFSQHPVTKRWFKIGDYVSFPIDGLNISTFMNNADDRPQVYDLGSVIVHKGSLDNGHYICYIRRKNQWYKCDDNIVTRVTQDEVKSCEAYILFYVCRVIQPLSCPKNHTADTTFPANSTGNHSAGLGVTSV